MKSRLKDKLLERSSKVEEVYWPEDPELEDIYSERIREEMLDQDGLSNEEDGFMKGYGNKMAEK